MKIFEYGIMKDGRNRLAYLVGAKLVETASCTPGIVLVDGSRAVLGEVQELSRAEVKDRAWHYSTFDRKRVTLSTGETANVYIPGEEKVRGAREIPSGIWVLPRVEGRVYEVKAPCHRRCKFSGSLREILEQMYREQWTVHGKMKFKYTMARRVKTLASRRVRTDTIQSFFADMHDAGVIKMKQVWPPRQK